MIAALGVLSVISCNKDIEESNTDNNQIQKEAIRFKAVADTPTRANLTDDYENNNAFKAAWESTDVITVDYGNGVYQYATWSDEDKYFIGSELTAKNDLFAYYPDTKDGYYPFGGIREQNGNMYNSYYDLMYSDKFDLKDGKNDIVVPMHRATAIQYFHLTADASAEWANLKVQSATLTVTGSNVCIASSSVLIGNDGEIASDDVQNSITITFKEGTEPYAKDAQLWFNVIPCTVESMTISVELEDGYTWTKTNNFGGNGYKFVAGKLGYVKGAPIYECILEPVSHKIICESTTWDASVSGQLSALKDGISILAVKDNSSSNSPVYSSNGNDVRVYANGTITIESDDNITSIVFNVSEQGLKRLAPITASCGTIKDQTSGDTTVEWAGHTKTVVFTVGDKANYGTENTKAGQLDFVSIDITTLSVPTPVVNVNGITLDKTSGNLLAGKTLTIAAAITPEDATNKNVTWSSSNEAVATVSDGVVTGLSAGSTDITVTTEDGEFTATCSVQVITPVYSSLEGLVADDIISGTLVTVSFTDVPIKSIYTSGSYRNGIIFDIQKDNEDIEIYYQNVPNEWIAGGTVSGTMTCPWIYFERGSIWELAPMNGTWNWDNLTYDAPSVPEVDSYSYLNEGSSGTNDGITVTGNVNTTATNGNPGNSFACTSASNTTFTFSGFDLTKYSNRSLSLDVKFSYPSTVTTYPKVIVYLSKNGEVVHTDDTTIAPTSKVASYNNYSLTALPDFDELKLVVEPGTGTSNKGNATTTYGMYIDNIEVSAK